MADITAANQARAEILAAELQDQYIGSESVLMQTIMDMSAQAAQGLKSVSLPKVSGQHAGADLPVGGATIGNRSQSVTGDVLLFNKGKEVSDYVSWVNGEQSAVDEIDVFFAGAPKSMAALFEAEIVTALTTASANDFNSGTLNSFDIDDLRAANTALTSARIPKAERFLAVSPASMAILSKMDEFAKSGYSLSNEALLDGQVGRILGFTVIESVDVADNKVHAYHRKSVAFGLQSSKVDEDYDAPASETYVGLKAIYGAKANQSGIGKLTITLAV